MAYTFTFPSTARQPSPEEVAGWLTERGEAFEAEGPYSLALRGLPVRLVVVPDEPMQAHVDVTPTTPLVRLVDLLFELSNRAATDVRLAGVGKIDRAALWLRMADDQDRARIARALARADEMGKRDDVVRGLWAVLAAANPGRDVRWDAGREHIVELREVGGPTGLPAEEAAFLLEDPETGDVACLECHENLHIVAWRWLSEAHPGLTD